MYYELPVYNDCMKLLVTLDRFSSNMSRDYKFTTGQRMRELLTNMIVLIYRANRIRDKRSIISEVKENLLEVQVLCRMLSEIGQISGKQFVALAEQTACIGKQLTAWEKKETQRDIGVGAGMEMPESVVVQRPSERAE